MGGCEYPSVPITEGDRPAWAAAAWRRTPPMGQSAPVLMDEAGRNGVVGPAYWWSAGADGHDFCRTGPGTVRQASGHQFRWSPGQASPALASDNYMEPLQLV